MDCHWRLISGLHWDARNCWGHDDGLLDLDNVRVRIAWGELVLH